MAERQRRRGFGLYLVVVVNCLFGCGGGSASDTDGGALEPPDAAITVHSSPACARPIICYPGYRATMCPEVVLKALAIPFDPLDSRWAADYQTCIDEYNDLIRPTECDWFCDAVVLTNSILTNSTGFGTGSIDCSRPDHPTITVEYSTVHCDPF